MLKAVTQLNCRAHIGVHNVFGEQHRPVLQFRPLSVIPSEAEGSAVCFGLSGT